MKKCRDILLHNAQYWRKSRFIKLFTSVKTTGSYFPFLHASLGTKKFIVKVSKWWRSLLPSPKSGQNRTPVWRKERNQCLMSIWWCPTSPPAEMHRVGRKKIPLKVKMYNEQHIVEIWNFAPLMSNDVLIHVPMYIFTPVSLFIAYYLISKKTHQVTDFSEYLQLLTYWPCHPEVYCKSHVLCITCSSPVRTIACFRQLEDNLGCR